MFDDAWEGSTMFEKVQQCLRRFDKKLYFVAKKNIISCYKNKNVDTKIVGVLEAL